MDLKFCIIIAGPTGVGKTALAVELARYWGAEVLSADSRQCYRELEIGVARPSPEEQKGIPHHFIASHSIINPVNAADFEAYALVKAAETFRARNVLIVAGGSGLYLQAFLEGMDEIPVVPDYLRSQVRELFLAEGLPGLLAGLPSDDPFLTGGELSNPHRVMRALEVYLATGRSIRSYQNGPKVKRDFIPILIGLDLPREALYDRINNRVEKMMERGLLEEAIPLMPYRASPPLQTVGYRELFEFKDGLVPLAKAVEKIKQHSRQYAKRQLTWFRSRDGMQWFDPDRIEDVLAYVKVEMRRYQTSFEGIER